MKDKIIRPKLTSLMKKSTRGSDPYTNKEVGNGYRTFGPYRQTPEKTIEQLDKGVDIGPSVIDAIPMDRQLDYEEIRGEIIRKNMKKPVEKNLWSGKG